ncbi:hypothetical protein MNV49_007499 [Pseudohyphozyma bogoriensis]|nr:hypothetical protein MNV49_007499 [Pseudohyphozyma bogoriensis]
MTLESSQIFPDETLVNIFDAGDFSTFTKADLASLCLVSKTFLFLARPLLYTHLYFERANTSYDRFDHPLEAFAPQPLVTALRSNPRLLTFVKRVDVNFAHFSDTLVDENLPYLLGFISTTTHFGAVGLAGNRNPENIQQALHRFLPELQRLSISETSCHSSSALRFNPSCFPTLKYLEIPQHVLVAAPSFQLEELVISGDVYSPAFESLILSSNSSLTYLTLNNNYGLPPHILCGYIRNDRFCPLLRSVEFINWEAAEERVRSALKARREKWLKREESTA